MLLDKPIKERKKASQISFLGSKNERGFMLTYVALGLMIFIWIALILVAAAWVIVQIINSVQFNQSEERNMLALKTQNAAAATDGTCLTEILNNSGEKIHFNREFGKGLANILLAERRRLDSDELMIDAVNRDRAAKLLASVNRERNERLAKKRRFLMSRSNSFFSFVLLYLTFLVAEAFAR